MTTLTARARHAVDALEHLVGGLATAVLALALLVWVAAVAVLSVVGIGLPLAPGALRGVRTVADRERARLSRWGPEIVPPEPLPARLRAALRSPAVGREVGWLAAHAI